MILEIAFNEINYREHNTIYFASIWKKVLKKQKQNMYYGLVLIIFGISIICGKNNIGFVLVFLGANGIMFWFRIYSHYQVAKRIYLKLIDKNVKEYLAHDQVSVWNLTDDYFHYYDYKLDVKMKWIALTGYRVIGNIIIVDSNVGICFILSRGEIGTQNFNEF